MDRIIIFYCLLFWGIPAFSCEVKSIPLTSDNFISQYSGYGAISFNPLQLSPKPPVKLNETHSALVLTQKQYQYFKLQITFQVVKQLRSQPNPWEVLWVFFNYQKTKLKNTNYFIFKTNGLEVGQAWGALSQHFIASTNTPTLKTKSSYLLTIIKDKKIQPFL